MTHRYEGTRPTRCRVLRKKGVKGWTKKKGDTEAFLYRWQKKSIATALQFIDLYKTSPTKAVEKSAINWAEKANAAGYFRSMNWHIASDTEYEPFERMENRNLTKNAVNGTDNGTALKSCN